MRRVPTILCERAERYRCRFFYKFSAGYAQCYYFLVSFNWANSEISTMYSTSLFLLLATISEAWLVPRGSSTGNSNAITISTSPPFKASTPILEAFVSYSIEFAFFPDFAGMPLFFPWRIYANNFKETVHHQMTSPTIFSTILGL